MSDKKYHQSRVSPFPDKNAQLTPDQRLINLEHDVITQSDSLNRLVDQNDKYANYLDERMSREHESYLFWRDVRKRLATAGIISTVGIIFVALGYAATQWVKHQ